MPLAQVDAGEGLCYIKSNIQPLRSKAMSETVTKTEEETKAKEEVGAKAQGGTKPAFKVSPLYEGDETVDLTDPFYSEENMRWIKLAEQQIREGNVVIKTMEELEAMAR